MLGDIRKASGNDSPIGATGLVSEPIDEVSTAIYFHSCFSERLAFFSSDETCDLFEACTHESSGGTHDFAAFENRDGLPGFETFFSSFDRFVQIIRCCMSKRSDYFSVCRIDYVFPNAFAAFAPFTVDE
ncbi:hypothetical protein D3C87_1458210 [compost metagenome]